MRRLALAMVPAVAGALALLVAAAPTASADLLPNPLPSVLPSLPPLLPAPLPTLPPVQVGPISTGPVTGPVDRVVGGVVNPKSSSGKPASAGDGGAGSGASSSAAAAPAAADPSPPPYQPPAAEQAALPAEQQRVALEGQQAWLAGAAPDLDGADTVRALAAGGGDGRFVWPVTFAGRPPITQRFGCTDVPGEPYSATCASHRFHTGLDLAVRTGTPVYATAAGVVHVIPSDSGYGNHVLIAHGDGWFTLYGHLSQFVVRDGDVVRRGDPIGLSGSTGFSTGPHLHYEVRYSQQTLDPCAFLGC